MQLAVALVGGVHPQRLPGGRHRLASTTAGEQQLAAHLVRVGVVGVELQRAVHGVLAVLPTPVGQIGAGQHRPVRGVLGLQVAGPFQRGDRLPALLQAEQDHARLAVQRGHPGGQLQRPVGGLLRGLPLAQRGVGVAEHIERAEVVGVGLQRLLRGGTGGVESLLAHEGARESHEKPRVAGVLAQRLAEVLLRLGHAPQIEQCLSAGSGGGSVHRL